MGHSSRHFFLEMRSSYSSSLVRPKAVGRQVNPSRSSVPRGR
jgi:hypothetical protein